MPPYDPAYLEANRKTSRKGVRIGLLMAGVAGILGWLIAGAITFVPDSQWIGDVTSNTSLLIGLLCLVCRTILKR